MTFGQVGSGSSVAANPKGIHTAPQRENEPLNSQRLDSSAGSEQPVAARIQLLGESHLEGKRIVLVPLRRRLTDGRSSAPFALAQARGVTVRAVSS